MASSIRLKRFYDSKLWKDFRMALIMERGNKCQICEKTGFDSANLVGHHSPVELTDENVDDVMISLNEDNVLIVCRWCHEEAHTRFGHGKKKVYLVHGSPQSGKSTYVMSKKKSNDLVVDTNLIYQALTGYAMYNKPNSLKQSAFAVWDTLLDVTKTRRGNWGTSWIIGSFPDHYKRQQIINDTGAEEIRIDTPMEECISRMENNPLLNYRHAEYRKYIEDYWRDLT